MRFQRILGALFCLLLIFVSAPTVFGLSPEQKQVIESGALNFNTEPSGCIEPVDGSGPNTVYLLGDSWLVRILASNPSLRTALENRGMTLLEPNAVVGRSINGAGQGDDNTQPQNALDAIEADEALIRSAGKIVIILGTNSDNYSGAIPELMEQLSFSSAQKYWVNTSANADSIAESASQANADIQANSSEGYSVINWFSLAFPGGNPTNIDTAAQSPLMDDDRIHPRMGEGTSALINLIADSITGGTGVATPSPTGSATRSSLPQVALDRLATIEPAVLENQSAYEEAAQQTALPWQVIAALHYRETGNSRTNPPGNDDGVFQIESLSFPPGAVNTDEELTEQAITAGNTLKSIAKAVYDVDLTPASPSSDLKLAFLAYNRGFLYKRVPPSEGGPWSPDLSPYVMNLYDQNFLGPDGDGMLFPIGTSGNRSGGSGTSRWGETVSGKNNPAGAMTFLAYFGMTAAGGGQNGCAGGNTASPGMLAWPVIDGSGPAGRITACWSDHRTRLNGSRYYHSGVDIAAGAGTDVISMQSGVIDYAGPHSVYGNLIIVRHNSGLWSHYGHLLSIESGVAIGAQIEARQKIGEVGNTGESLGNHLHLNLYDSWPFGPLPSGAANGNGRETLNALTNGLSIPSGISDEVGCMNYPNGGRETTIGL